MNHTAGSNFLSDTILYEIHTGYKPKYIQVIDRRFLNQDRRDISDFCLTNNIIFCSLFMYEFLVRYTDFYLSPNDLNCLRDLNCSFFVAHVIRERRRYCTRGIYTRVTNNFAHLQNFLREILLFCSTPCPFLKHLCGY